MFYPKPPVISENESIEFCWETFFHFIVFMFSIILIMVIASGIQGWRAGVNPFHFVTCKYKGHDPDRIFIRYRGFEDSKICVEKLKAK